MNGAKRRKLPTVWRNRIPLWLTQTIFQETVLDCVGGLCNTNAITEITNSIWCISAATKSAEGRHAGVIPTGNVIVLNKGAKLALAEYGVVNSKASKLDLPGLVGNTDVFNDPIIERSVIFKLQ